MDSGPQIEHITGCIGGGLRSSSVYRVWSNVGLLYSQARLVRKPGITDTCSQYRRTRQSLIVRFVTLARDTRRIHSARLTGVSKPLRLLLYRTRQSILTSRYQHVF